VSGSYKYNAEDYKDILNMYDDLKLFYELLERYNDSKARSDRLPLEKHGRDLFFTVKHRELEGNLSHAEADGLREYIRGLLDD
jgi:hypothetical protein